jgi:mycothiol synthase
VTSPPLRRVEPGDFPSARREIAALEEAARASRGFESLGESAWRDLARPAPDSVGFFAGTTAYIHVSRAESGDPAAWTATFVTNPDLAAPGVVTILLAAAVDHVAVHGGRSLACWVTGSTGADDTEFAASGFEARGTLFEMRAPLPITEAATLPSGMSIRTFEPGRDERDWLAVNNRAFAGHPDQGDWREQTLRDRMAEDWFDPSVFLLAFDDKGLAGFNWCKQHNARPPDPELGEIYVIGVDPRAQGTGLGRALAVEALHVLYAKGAVVGDLFCAADNTGALALYRSLGFSVHRTDRAYARQIEPR